MAAAEVPSGLEQGPPDMLNDDPKAAAVRAQLERILTSRQFRGTKRSQEFLRFVVERKLKGQVDTLKERWIGVEIFGRSPDYDTGEDAIVRVKANEVRKRLAQYHAEAAAAEVVDIELPAGSYVPEFRWMAVPEPIAAAPAAVPLPPATACEQKSQPPVPAEASLVLPRRPASRWLVPAAALLVVAAVSSWLVLSRQSSPVDRFWAPFRSAARPPVLAVESRPEANGGVTAGDAIAAAEIAALLARMGNPPQVRVGTAAFSDAPSLVVGVTGTPREGARFLCERGPDGAVIRDVKAPGRTWVWRNEQPFTDHAVLSRVFDRRNGQPALFVAGLSPAGARIVTGFLASDGGLRTALGALAPGWETQNFQILLRAEVRDGSPGPVQVVETHLWQ